MIAMLIAEAEIEAADGDTAMKSVQWTGDRALVLNPEEEAAKPLEDCLKVKSALARSSLAAALVLCWVANWERNLHSVPWLELWSVPLRRLLSRSRSSRGEEIRPEDTAFEATRRETAKEQGHDRDHDQGSESVCVR